MFNDRLFTRSLIEFSKPKVKKNSWTRLRN